MRLLDKRVVHSRIKPAGCRVQPYFMPVIMKRHFGTRHPSDWPSLPALIQILPVVAKHGGQKTSGGASRREKLGRAHSLPLRIAAITRGLRRP